MRRVTLLLFSSLLLVVGLPAIASAAEGDLEVVFLDAGQGDTVLYRGSCGEVGIIDVNRGADDEVLAQLSAWGATDDVVWMSVSHYDADHLGGVTAVGTALAGLEAVYDRGGDRNVKDTITYRDYYDWVTSAGLRTAVEIGDAFELCGTVVFDVVSVGTDGTAAGGVSVSAENDRGVCVNVSVGEFDLASCGDVNKAVETAVAPAYGQVEVVKVSHHGSDTSSSQTFIDTLDADVAIFTVGSNSFGHPDPDVVSRWETSGATLFQTATSSGAIQDGDVTVTATADGAYTVAGETGRVTSSDSNDGLVDAPDVQPITPACVDAPAGRFADVSGVHQPGIDCIGWWGVTQGVGDGLYDPFGDVRRDQMASFIARTLDLTGGSLPASPADVFSDDDGNVHEPAINQLAALEVVGGVTANSYAPFRSVTRAQMASFLARAWEARVGTPLPAGGDFFGDDDGDTHEANINRVAAAGLTGGTASGGYEPGAQVTRAQMGTFLARLLAKMVADGHITYPPANPVPITDPDPEPACVDLNTADLEALQEIVHIGPGRAQDIIDLRPWASVQDLDVIDGIGPARLQDIIDEGVACVT